MPSYNIDNAPKQLDMTTFDSISSKYGALAKSCRYVARIVPVGRWVVRLAQTGITNDLMYLCETTEFPGRGMMTMDLRYYGPSFKIPFQTSYEDINMTFLCREQSFERQFFDDWLTMINPTDTFDFRYRDDYKCNLEIFQYSDYSPTQSGKSKQPAPPIYAFTLLDAWPTVVNPQQVTWADDQFLRLGVSFTYHWWIRKGRDPEYTDTTPQRTKYDLVQGSKNIY